MFLPLHDGVPLKNLRKPFVTRGLILVCTGVYLLVLFGAVGANELVGGFGLIPGVVFGTEVLPPGYPFVPPVFTLVTNVFVHVSLIHLAGNMLFLWVFGDNVEDAMGHLRFGAFFLICGTIGSLAHAFATGEQHRPLIGASGGIAGVVASYLILYPRVRIWGLFLKGIPLRLPAYCAIGFWFALQVVSAFFGGDAAVGWFAHLAGFVAGAMLTPLMRHRFDPVIARLEAQEISVLR
jgi:membrane associated rhomboid family serine protease